MAKRLPKKSRCIGNMRAMARSFLIITLCLVCGCRSSGSETERGITDDVKDIVGKAGKVIDDYTPDRRKIQDSTMEEAEKLFTLEYRVIDLSSDTPAADVEKQLNTLGKERWDCFKVERRGANLRFYCKRMPRTFLRFIPRFF